MEAPVIGSRRKLMAIWLVLAALGVAIYLGETKRSERVSAPIVRDERKLLPLPIESIGAIELINKGTLHRFERDQAGLWFYHGMHAASQGEHAHQADRPAADLIDKALTAFGRTRRERTFPLNAAADEFGVTRPDLFIMVYQTGSVEPLARFAVGIVTVDNFGRYVLPVGSAEVVTIADFQIKNLLDLIDVLNRPADQSKP